MVNTSTVELPNNQTNPERPLKRQHTGRYYYVQLACTIFVGLLLIIGIIFFILWLTLNPRPPSFIIHDFSIPSLTKPPNIGYRNAHIKFNVTARNSNQGIYIFYKAMDVTLLYKEQSIGTSSWDPFYHAPENTTVLVGDLTGADLTVTKQQWQAIIADLRQGKVDFRLQFTSTFRYRITTSDTRNHTMRANCQVVVGTDGLILAQYRDKRCQKFTKS